MDRNARLSIDAVEINAACSITRFLPPFCFLAMLQILTHFAPNSTHFALVLPYFAPFLLIKFNKTKMTLIQYLVTCIKWTLVTCCYTVE